MELDNIIEACYSVFNERQELLKTVKTEDEFKKWQTDSLHFYRMQLEPYVFNYLNHTYGHKLDAHWKLHQFPKTARYAFVICERRIHPNWWFVLRNIAWAAPHCSLYIFCSDINYNFVKSLLGDKAENVHIHQFFKGVADREKGCYESSLTFRLPQFYKLIDAEYFINVQMDSYFLQKIPDWIFVGTYYGSPWGWDPNRGGNGGLSVRNTAKLVELCEKEIEHALVDRGEDCYLSDAATKHGHFLPPLTFRERVFQENYPTVHIPIGTHQFWTYIMNYNMGNKEAFKEHYRRLLTIIDL
jgi:hypothetical protein